MLASGANPGETTYTIEASAALPRITAIRLEALPDPSLPKGGPGRDIYGNFQLNGVDDAAQPLERGRYGAARTRVVATAGHRAAAGAPEFANLASRPSSRTTAARAWTRSSRRRCRATLYAPRGWRIDASREDTRLPRQIVFTLDRPLGRLAGRATRLRIRLKHQGAVVGQALGRFRLSVTSSSTPQRVVEIPARLRPILAIAAADRTEQQRKDLAAFYRTVAPSLKPTRDRVAELQKKLKALGIPTALVMRERVGYERPSAFVRRRGSFLDKGEQVYAGVPAFLPPLGDDQMPNRLGLARWLVDEENPLTARVAVNRAWEQFFGRGLVETSEDFGTQGSPPSHPELLDWLATELVRQGWRTKALHKLIVTSATYRQSSAAPPAARGARSVQPSARARSALPDGSGNGPRHGAGRERAARAGRSADRASSRRSPTASGTSRTAARNGSPSDGEDRYRRGLYVFIRRSAAYPSFMTFDATSREHCTVRRVRTNTPLQALTTLNDEAFFEAARALAARVLRERSRRSGVGAAADAEARRGERPRTRFRLAVDAARRSRTRSTRIVGLVQRGSSNGSARIPEAAARAIKGYAVAGVDPAEQAAWTLVANALLNLDEALTRE